MAGPIWPKGYTSVADYQRALAAAAAAGVPAADVRTNADLGHQLVEAQAAGALTSTTIQNATLVAQANAPIVAQPPAPELSPTRPSNVVTAERAPDYRTVTTIPQQPIQTLAPAPGPFDQLMTAPTIYYVLAAAALVALLALRKRR